MRNQNTWFLGNLVRVPVYMDIGALITVVWIASVMGGDLRRMLLAIVAFLAAIVLHELGHALAARARGMIGIHIVISALGGYCSYLGEGRPSARLMISLAGPAVNFLLVALLWFLFYLLALDYHAAGYVPADWWSILQAALARRLPEMPDLAAMFCELAAYGWWVNVSLGILNLMPVFPLDGGQAVYRILQMTVDERQARSSTLAISVVGAIGCIALFTWLSGEPSTFLIVLMLFLLYQAWSTLA